ncbi:hypothetical protein MFIFM68171_06679 [Madurella fahalii]|uniref:Heterokaryon incompatibility domain-containing protein n=1 Tax=Madurella fahalii TaxID=1157608 RepID=A0ABQ0GFM2_9PEZI
MAPYQYRPLPASHIRLLELHPSTDPTAALTASVLTVPLHPPLPTTTDAAAQGDDDYRDATARFEALSYAWGDPATPAALHLADGTAIPITASLSSLLARIRRPDAPRVLWVDAVCINQGDPAEKAVQVGMMDVIYRAAERVIADLGEDEDEDEGGEGDREGREAYGMARALRIMERYWRAGIRAGADKTGFGRALTPAETARALGLEDEVELGDAAGPREGGGEGQGDGGGGAGALDFTDDERLAVLRFFDRPWFRRVWIVQEFVLARQVVMLCGRNEANWRHLMASCVKYEGIPVIVRDVLNGDLGRMAGMTNFICMAWIRCLRALQRTESGRQFVSHLSSLSNGRMMRYYGNPTLASLLHYFRLSHATLGRDRYFALLKISSDIDVEEHPELRPDYTAPDHEIVQRFARVLIRKEGAAEMFMRAGLWRQMKPELPSWAEDATQGNSALLDLTLEDTIHKAAGGTEFAAHIDSNLPNIITVKACRVDTVQELASSWQDVVDGGRQGLWATLEYLRRGFVLFLRRDLSTGHAGWTEPYATGEDAEDAAALTLCTYRGMPNPSKEALVSAFALLRVLMFLPEGFQTLEDVRDVILAKNNCSEELVAQLMEKAPGMMDLYLQELGSMVGMGVTPAVTWGNYFANVPPVARPGDEVWIVQGCRFPMLLRRTDGDEFRGDFRLVGTCYVHGLMNGETLQRPGFEFENISIC